ncbi:MAG TPA: ABC transporter substrate-binding protein [Clostridium sp.]|uniref:ABC transporter substrate-binding protein n=1 Tax=Clostridium lapidicellarium TaxID=3240931 RepID=A0ABV4DYL3_9CLOT|nr:ABC transporter substrate-binding protein [uncultured Clostridium sp.]HBC98041.1 ABC transporter substrate-binding protein [Clostridium sp.]
MKKSKVLAFMLSVLIVVSLTGCGSKSPQSSSGKLENVDLVLDWYPNAIHSFIYAAIEKGYFKEEGLKVNIKFPSDPTDPLTLPAAGRATLGIYYQPDLIIARANQGVPVKSVGAVVHTPLNVIIALKSNNIKSPKDLQGKTVGYSGNPLNTEYVKTMVKKDGGNPGNVKMVDVGFDLLSSMVTKKVDATTGGLINHEVLMMENENHPVNYFDPSKYGVPNYYEEVFVTSDKTLKEKPETIKKFMKAAQKGFEYTKNNPDKALKILMDNQQKGSFPLKENVEKKSLSILLPKMESKNEPFLSQDKSVWQNNINWFRKQGLLKKNVNPEDFYVNILVEDK